MMQKQTVYLPVNGEPPLVVCYDHSDWYDSITGVVEKEGYFFTPEQLNEYTQSVIKQSLETAAENAEVRVTENALSEDGSCYTTYDDGVISITSDKQSITNTFEETFKKFKV
jgi:hypothetical protein